MFKKIRTSRITKIFVVLLSILILNSIFYPTLGLCLTGGPNPPEVQSFEPIETNQMVDLFSGDFTYNIPLFDLPGPNGGYPFNIAYNSGISLDQEASWVGLGWNINPGAINRTVRGFPDDFNGTSITQTRSMKDNYTVGADFGFDFEIVGASLDKMGLDANLSLTAYYNSFKGIGMGVGFGATVSKGEKTAGLSLSVDSQNGSSMSIQQSIGKKIGDDAVSANMGLTMHSKRGLSLSLGGGISGTRDKLFKGKVVNSSSGGSSSISFAERSFNPAIQLPTVGFNFHGTVDIGAGVMGTNPDMRISGFYNCERIKDKGEPVGYKVYGYDFLHVPFDNEPQKKDYLLDFQREKDNLLTKYSQNLAIPSLTYDVYSIQGQGISGMFRGFRSDIGHVHDQIVTSESMGLSGGLDIDPAQQFGGSGYFSTSINETKDWNDNDGNALYSYKFKSSVNQNNEPVYFRLAGEHTTSMSVNEYHDCNADKPVSINVEDGEILSSNYQGHELSSKASRATFIEKKSGSDISKIKASNKYSEFTAEYYNFNKTSNTYIPLNSYKDIQKSVFKPNINDNTSAISVLNPDGRKYVYALPVMNDKKKEYVFSVEKDVNKLFDATIDAKSEDYSKAKGTDEYLNIMETPTHATAFLLSGVYGADYVDLTGDGPTDDDYGYWVKFNYTLTDLKYSWRAPYSGANYDPGLLSYKEDDKGSYVYGEKQQYYLASVETKTHIAVFQIVPRNDGVGAKDEANNAINGKMYRLEKVDLYTKENFKGSNPSPLKTIKFDYTYELCPGVENNIINLISNGDYDPNGDLGTGKLTLKSITILNKESLSGENSPYLFNYNSVYYDENGHSYNNNYPYSKDHYDRWGQYAENSDKEFNRNFPYTQQNSKFLADLHASAWHLTDITLPSGGEIHVSYESDDYAYVQHRQANQMFKISKVGANSQISNQLFSAIGNDRWDRNSSNANFNQRRIYFDLETPVSDTSTEKYFKNLYLRGLSRSSTTDPSDNNTASSSKIYQLYFKVKVKISEYKQEYISGYVNLDMSDDSPATCGYGFDEQSLTNGEYTRGFVTVQSTEVETKWGTKSYYHPFAVAMWKFLQNNKPDILADISVKFTDKQDGGAIAGIITSSAQMISGVADLFVDFTTTAFSKNVANKIDLEHSVIRLCSPDKIKYGGGSRVKKITYNDNWNKLSDNGTNGQGESNQVLGQVYEYTTYDPKLNRLISSGVASYEPMIGGEENALRWAKSYTEDAFFATKDQKFNEYPINESYFPAEGVGYSKVRVFSLNSYEKYIKSLDTDTKNDIAYAGSGYTEHEFYTYKEFPIRFYESKVDIKSSTIPIFIPFIGTLTYNQLTGGQGYSVVINDMHGKPKSVKAFAQPQGATAAQKMVSSTEYFYKSKDSYYDGAYIKIPDNIVEVLLDNEPQIYDQLVPESLKPVVEQQSDVVSYEYRMGKSKTDKVVMGVDYEYFYDFRNASSRSSQGGLDFNIDNFTIITIPLPWPSIYDDENTVKTAVSNKVVNKSGILDHVTVKDENSAVTTYNELWDKYTGEVLMTRTQNLYNNDVYSYSVPAYMEYPEMSPSYISTGYKFSTYATQKPDNFTYSGTGDIYYLDNSYLSLGLDKKMSKGDRLVLTEKNDKTISYLITYQGYDENSKKYSFTSATSINTSLYNQFDCQIFSSHTNQLTDKCENYNSLATEIPYVENGKNNYSPLIKFAEQTTYRNGQKLKAADIANDLTKFFKEEVFECKNSGEQLDIYKDTKDNNASGNSINDNYSILKSAFTVSEYTGYERLSQYINNITVCKYRVSVVFTEESQNYFSGNIDHFEIHNLDSDNKCGCLTIDENDVTQFFSSESENLKNLFNSSEAPTREQLYNVIHQGMIAKDKDNKIVKGNLLYVMDIHWTDFAMEQFGFTNRHFFGTNNANKSSFVESYKSCFGGVAPEDDGYYYFNVPISFTTGIVENLGTSKVCNYGRVNEYDYKCDETFKGESVFKLDVPDLSDLYTKDNVIIIEGEYSELKPPHMSNLLSAQTSTYKSAGKAMKNESVYSLDDIRTSSLDNPQKQKVDLANDGILAGFSNLHLYDDFSWSNVKSGVAVNNIWYKDNTITSYNSNGMPVESQNNVGLYQSVKYGLNNTVPVIVADNAKKNTLSFIDFEDYSTAPENQQFLSYSILNSNDVTIVNDISCLHSGKQSLKGNTVKIGLKDAFSQGGYRLQAWIKINRPLNLVKCATYNELNRTNLLKISCSGVLINDVNFKFLGYIVDGWQRIEATFSLPANIESNCLTLEFSNYPYTNTTDFLYVDDIRIFPDNAVPRSYVYDIDNLRLSAELDENNYATFYYYDEKGSLFLVKKETEDGLKTIQESRNYIRSNNP